MTAAGIELLRPWWLAGLPLLLVAGVWSARRRGSFGAWEAAIDPGLRATLTRLGHLRPGRGAVRNSLAVLVAGGLLIALAGPARRDKDAPAFRDTDAIVIVLDLSRSVTRGGNLDDAQAAAVLIAQRAAGRPVALVLFAGEAYLATAPTTDPATLESLIAVLDPETMPDQGSAPEKALALARRVLEDGGVAAGDVVVLSDGGGLNPVAVTEAERIKAGGGQVSTLFIAPEDLPAGAPPPDRDALKGLSAAGGGAFAEARQPATVSDSLARWSGNNALRQDLIPLLYTDYGRYLVVLAMIPALLMFRRRG